MKALLKNPITWIVLSIGAVALVVALYLFQPWRLLTNVTVNEAAPAGPTVGAPASPGQPNARQVREVASGTFITHEHKTTGSAKILQLADGSRVLRLENLSTSDGPDLRVWLSDQPVKPGEVGWRVFDDGKYVELGELKGNIGSSNYVIPKDANLDSLTSVSIWCKRFSVSFGAADLKPA